MYILSLISKQYSLSCLQLEFFPVNLPAPSSLLFLIGFFNILGINIVFNLDVHIFVIYQVVASNLEIFRVTDDMSNRNMFGYLKGT